MDADVNEIVTNICNKIIFERMVNLKHHSISWLSRILNAKETEKSNDEGFEKLCIILLIHVYALA